MAKIDHLVLSPTSLWNQTGYKIPPVMRCYQGSAVNGRDSQISGLCFEDGAESCRKGQDSTIKVAYELIERNRRAIRPYVGIVVCRERPESLGMALLAVGEGCVRGCCYTR